jgi:hypothetical protein
MNTPVAVTNINELKVHLHASQHTGYRPNYYQRKALNGDSFIRHVIELLTVNRHTNLSNNSLTKFSIKKRTNGNLPIFSPFT